MGNLRSNMTEEEWEEAEKRALMSEEKKAKKAAIKDMEEDMKVYIGGVEYTLSYEDWKDIKKKDE